MESVRVWTQPFSGDKYVNINDLIRTFTVVAESADASGDELAGQILRIIRDKILPKG